MFRMPTLLLLLVLVLMHSCKSGPSHDAIRVPDGNTFILVGTTGFSALREAPFSDWFGPGYNGFSPDPEKIEALRPLLEGRTRDPHEQLFWEWSGNRAIREGDMKLVWDKGVRKWELYDLTKDRTETSDLADQQPARVEAMSAAWFSWAEKTGLR